MSESMLDFHREFIQEVYRESAAGGRFAEDAFFELFTKALVEAGELETADRSFYERTRGLRVDGYGGDPADANGVLSLIISTFHHEEELVTLTRTRMEAIFKRLQSFLEKSLDSKFRSGLEETSPGFALADLIFKSWSQVSKVKLVLITNHVLSNRIDGQQSDEINGRPIVHSAWDLGRLYRYSQAGTAREELVIDMIEHGGALPVLPAHLNGADYQAYLMVLRGDQLASIYDRWGARLLEQNVRVFLQAKGGVNKGIKRTIEHEPQMFFAYNNGISATAEDVTIENTVSGQRVTHLKNFQIVNGGQSTASIYAASRAKRALGDVFIQVKLSVITPSRAEEVIPKISEYANTQNKVNAADFFSNHPFHLRMKELSESIYAPSRDGRFTESKWFYERARGQYQDAKANLTSADRKKFDLEFPKEQLFNKTDLAKVAMIWRGSPHTVSKGSQKNFGEFAKQIGPEWDRDPAAFNEQYFRHTVARIIMYSALEKIVSGESWYEGGYRAQIVTYAIAKLVHDLRVRGACPDLDAVWRAQALPPSLQDALRKAAIAVKDVLTSPPAGSANVTEWAKQDACWTRVQGLRVEWPKSLATCSVSAGEVIEQARNARREQKEVDGIQALMLVANAGYPFWKNLAQWARAKKLLSSKQLESIDVAARRNPTDRQAIEVLKALRTAQAEGFPENLPANSN
jgi:hypothetical protein